MTLHILDIFPVILFFIGFFGLITTTNIIKSIVFIMLLQTAVITFWLGVGSRLGVVPPIIGDIAYLESPDAIADPLPQALMLTAIIIGIAVTAVNITMLNGLFKKHKTVNWQAMEELERDKEEEEF